MKFGKYLASRSLELPEYSGYFIDYKALKKLIKQLTLPQRIQLQRELTQDEIQLILKENKSTFFFKLERELEKVNSFYLEKQSNLAVNLNILISKKKSLLNNHNKNFKNSITYSNLYNSFRKFAQDLKKLELFIELNEVGFTKVLKKWDKRSKSHLKELFIATAVNVQPVFHRHEINDLSDLVANCLLELESRIDGNIIKFVANGNTTSGVVKGEKAAEIHSSNGDVAVSTAQEDELDKDKEIDELYLKFIDILTSPEDEISAVLETYLKTLSISNYKISKIFNLLIPKLNISDVILADFHAKFADRIDLVLINELTGKNAIHEACGLLKGRRKFIIDTAIEKKVDLMMIDSSGRNCLHYCSENEREDVLDDILQHIKHDTTTLDTPDNDSMTPLLIAIKHRFSQLVELYLSNGANSTPLSNGSIYLPINYTCQVGDVEILKSLVVASEKSPTKLDSTKKVTSLLNQPDVEGLYPLHIIAKNGHYQLTQYLVETCGLDVNQLDGLNKWSPLFYGVLDGHVEIVEKLIQYGADIGLMDEKGFDVMYYGVFEGNFDVLNLLIDKRKEQFSLDGDVSMGVEEKEKTSPKDDGTTTASSNADIDIDTDMIPDFQLPPPIIPLRRYGHNFLEQKIFIQLTFLPGNDSIHLYPDLINTNPGRLTISSTNHSDIIPRNVLLPIVDSNNQITFQIDLSNFSNFQIDFELFPSFGTRLVAKTTSLLNFFDKNDKINGMIRLPFFDVRLRNVGELKFFFQIIQPFSGVPLEISKFETYWKSSGSETVANTEANHLTYSSLSGSYIRIKVCVLDDGTPIVCPSWSIEVANGIQMLLPNLSLLELNTLTNALYDYPKLIKDLAQSTNLKLIEKLLKIIYIPLSEFLNIISIDVNLNIELVYPSDHEFKSLNFSNKVNHFLNEFIDNSLTNIFDDARVLRAKNEKLSRSILFSSNNSVVCKILNWKQPNYPVFLNMSGVNCGENGHYSVKSINGLDLDDIKEAVNIKESLNFIANNNLLGIIIPISLLNLTPNLIKTIRSRGLILIGSGDNIDEKEELFGSTKNEINGVRFNDVLRFKESM